MKRWLTFKVMNFTVLIYLLSLAISLVVIGKDIEELSLQQLIDDAKPGDYVIVPQGFYEESILIDKPIHLQAEHFVRLVGQGNEPVVNIVADEVYLDGFHIDVQGNVPMTPAILLRSDRNLLTNLKVTTNGVGIRLEEAHHNVLDSVVVNAMTESTSRSQRKGNGIDLYKSHNNTIRNNRVTGMYDAIYLESSNDNLVEDNRSRNSRYGYHLMFTQNNVVRNNEGSGNITGAMIMGSERIEVTRNTMLKQSKHVHSLGILLYDVQDSVVSENIVADNRVGLFVEQSKNNQIINNSIQQNYIGLQMRQASDNEFKHNFLIGNVIQSQAQQSENNVVEQNYWDDLQGIDVTGDGYSDLAYEINPFFVTLTGARPALQLFFQSPGLLFLESILRDDTSAWTKDLRPLMSLPDPSSLESYQTNWPLVIISLLMLGCSVQVILMGVRKT